MSSRETLGEALIAIVSGVALGLAFPREDVDSLAWVALAPVIVTALSHPPRRAFLWGWLTGTTFFLLLLRWLNFTFGTYSSIPGPLIYVPTIALAAYCGLFLAGLAATVSWIGQRRPVEWALLAFPFLWVAAEWIRGHLMGGFPWGLLGYSQYRELAVIQIAEIGGVYAVSFLLAVVNCAVAGALVQPWRRGLGGLLVAGVLVALSVGFGVQRLRAAEPAPTARVAVMQPSIEQPLKFEPEHAADTLRIYLELTRRAAAQHPRLLVWPETATPTPLRRDPVLLQRLTDVSARLHLPLLVGSIDVAGGSPPRYRNSAFLVTEHGIAGRYDKIQLVPFGEYVPFSGVLNFVRGWAEFIADLEPGSRAVVFPGPPAPFGVVICYEGIFPELFREFVRGGARLMINITNDAWFGRTSGPAQHLAMYPFRAVEHRTSIVRAANTGISAIIAPTGRTIQRLNLFERDTMTEVIPLRTVTTIYTRFGDWLAWLAMAVSAAALAGARWWPRSRPGAGEE